MPPGRQHSLFASRLTASLFCLLPLLELAGQATCRPTQVSRNSLRRQHQDGSPQLEVVHTSQNITLLSGVVVEHCTLTFTPVSPADSPSAIKLVKSCAFENANGPGSYSGGTGGTTTLSIGSTNGCIAKPPASSTTRTPNPSATPAPLTPSSAPAASNSTSSTIESSSIGVILSQPMAQSTVNTTSPMSTINVSSTPLTTSLSGPLPSDSAQVTSTLPSSSLTVIPTSTSTVPSSSISGSGIPPPSPLSSSSESPSTFTSTTTLAASTVPASNVAAVGLAQSNVFPKAIGVIAGVSVLLLIIGITIGYIKYQRMKRKASREQIRWPGADSHSGPGVTRVSK